MKRGNYRPTLGLESQYLDHFPSSIRVCVNSVVWHSWVLVRPGFIVKSPVFRNILDWPKSLFEFSISYYRKIQTKVLASTIFASCIGKTPKVTSSSSNTVDTLVSIITIIYFSSCLKSTHGRSATLGHFKMRSKTQEFQPLFAVS